MKKEASKKKSNGTNRLTSLHIMEIIGNAGPNGIRKSAIKKKLEENYDQVIDLKTLGFFLEDLLYGEKIRRKDEFSKLYVLEEGILEDEDLDILEDLITYSKSIDKKYVQKLLEKTSKLRKRKSLSNKKYLAEKLLRTSNVKVIENLRIIREAISKKKRIRISPKKGMEHSVSPYELVIFNSIYYLVCYYEGRDTTNPREKLETRRIDRIDTVEILKEDILEFKDAFSSAGTAEFDISDYIAKRIYPMSGDDTKIILKIHPSAEDTLRENFLNVDIRKSPEATRAFIETNKNSFIPWYVSYSWVGEIEQPRYLREEIREYAQKIVDKYQKLKLD